MGRVHPLDAVTERPSAPHDAGSAGGGVEPEDLTLPVLVKHRLVGLDLDRAEARDAAEVMDSIHTSQSRTTRPRSPRAGENRD